MPLRLEDELAAKLDECPEILRASQAFYYDTVVAASLSARHIAWVYMTFYDTALVDNEDGLVILRFHEPERGGYTYLAWSRSSEPQPLEAIEGLFWCYEGFHSSSSYYPRDASDILVSEKLVSLFPCAPASPVVASIALEGDPIEPFPTQGDLWLNTWADDDDLYSGWGDGTGVAARDRFTDCGVARFSGALPEIAAEERCFDAPTADPAVNDKPSSLLFFDGRLYGQFHSPLGDAWIGYLAYSDDYGETWTRVGFYRQWEKPPQDASPWTRDRNSHFRCLFFINMGKNYQLNTDGYVYGLGIGREWFWFRGVYLTRVPKGDILDYKAYEYFTGTENDEPQWSESQFDAIPLPGVRAPAQGSAMYHPGLERYLFLTEQSLYDAPNPWGPWTFAGSWAKELVPTQWQGGYQPGIISKDTGPDYFWFTISGQNKKPLITYNLHLGKMVMKLRESAKNVKPKE